MWHRSVAVGLRRLFRRHEVEQELDEEVEQYLEMAAREYVRLGLPRAEAERAARIGFGGVEAAKEGVRGFGWEALIDTLLADVRYAMRGMHRAPGFTIAAVLTLALGIGVNTAMFSVVNGVLLGPLPYRDASRLVQIWTDDVRRGLHEERTASRTIEDWRDGNHTLEAIAYYSAGRATLDNPGSRARTRRAFISGNFFSVLGVAPLAGRGVSDIDVRGAALVAVISYSLWQRRFGGDSSVVGQSFMLETDGKTGPESYRVIGVMPPRFRFPDPQTEIWTPATAYWRYARESGERFPSWARRWVAIARMRPGTSVSDVRADLRAIGQRLTMAYGTGPADFPGFAADIVPLRDSIIGQHVQTALWLLLGAVALVLCVACVNVANLVLARGAARRHEFALRHALGASRGRLLRQLLVETLLLSMIGGTLGVALAIAATRGLGLAAAARLPRADEVGVDARVLAFAALISIVSGILFGLVPALRVSALESRLVLQESRRTGATRGAMRGRELLIVTECALTIVLLAGAGLLLRSLERVRAVDAGFDPRHVLTMRVEFPPEPPTTLAGAEAVRARVREQTLNDLATRVGRVPGVEAVGFVDDMFISGAGNSSIAIPGRLSSPIVDGELNDGAVTPGFFSALHVPLRRGRFLNSEDARAKIRALWAPIVQGGDLAAQERSAIAEPVVVNESFARRYFPDESPIGRRFCVDPVHKTYWYEIVGVIGDMHRQGLEHEAIPEYFGPFIPSPLGRSDLLVRVQGDPLALAPVVRQLVLSTVPNALVSSVSTADRELGAFSAERRFQTSLLTSFAALALVLAGVGVYGVVHYTVAERTREIGIRMALGARAPEVLRLVVARGLRAPLAGIGIGIVGALAATRALTHLLFGTSSADPLTYVVVTVTLGAVAACACYLPARRAATTDPMIALRND
jgi:putative ABC transport system permease protein